jgi:ribonuclease VapC
LTVVDTSALIAILQNEAEAGDFFTLLSDEVDCQIGAPTKFELLMVAARKPTGQEDVRQLLSVLNVATIDWTDQLADIAAKAFLTYGKGRHPAALNFGDCMSYALAKSRSAPLLFTGDDFSKTDIRSAL